MGAQLVHLLGFLGLKSRCGGVCSFVGDSMSAPEPIQVVGWILVALGLKGPTPLLPVTLGYPHSLHLPCGPPMGDSLSHASLTTAVSSLTPAGQSSVLLCAHMI